MQSISDAMKSYFSMSLRLDEKSRSKVMKLMSNIASKYNTYTSITESNVPHISITYPNEKIDDKEISEIESAVAKDLARIRPFPVEINGIKSFKKVKEGKPNYVVFLRVIPNKSLAYVNKICNSYVKEHDYTMFKSFNPHITVARGDIDKNRFNEILREYRNTRFRLIFTVKSITSSTRRSKTGNSNMKEISVGKQPRA